MSRDENALLASAFAVPGRAAPRAMAPAKAAHVRCLNMFLFSSGSAPRCAVSTWAPCPGSTGLNSTSEPGPGLDQLQDAPPGPGSLAGVDLSAALPKR